MSEALITHHSSTATVVANDPRPLDQAIRAVALEYGWMVDYEDSPVTVETKLIDVANPQWKLQHPEYVGTRIASGGAFRSDYEDGPMLATSNGEEAALRTIVDSYNRSGNPGKFTVRDEGEATMVAPFPPFKSLTVHRYSVVATSVKNEIGEDQAVSPILDTPVTISIQPRSAQATIDEIARALTLTSHTRVVAGGWGINILVHSHVTVGGENVPARKLLMQALNATQRPQRWALLYGPGEKWYVINIATVSRAMRQADGTKVPLPIDFGAIRIIK